MSFIPVMCAQKNDSAEVENRLRTLNGLVEQNAPASTVAMRAQAMLELMRTDPERALAAALSEDTSLRLRANQELTSDVVEAWEEFEGQAEVLIVDDFEGKHSETRTLIHTKSGILEAHFTQGEEVQNGSRIKASGIRLGNVVAARATAVTPAIASCLPTGEQRVLVLLLNFRDSTLPPDVNVASMRDAFFGATNSLDAHWRESSYGKTSASGDVFGPFTLPEANYASNQLGELRSDAINMADASVDFSRYTRVFLIYPTVFPQQGAAGTVGCGNLLSNDGEFMASTSWIRADFMHHGNACTPVHEGGHNLGLRHASNVAYNGGPLGALGDPGAHTEYGDQFSAMSHCAYYDSRWVRGHYAAQHKVQLGWLGGLNVQTVEQPGDFTLAPLELNQSSLQVLRVRRGPGNDKWLWLEYRQPIGDDVTLSSINSQVYTGALIHYEDPSVTSYFYNSRLLDFTAQTSPGNFGDPTLVAGQSWSDPYSPLKITVNSASGSGLSVSVRYDTNCAVVSPLSANVPAGASTGTASVTAPSGCSWTAVSNAAWITVTSGASGNGNGTVGYSVAANSSASSRTGTLSIGSQTFTITQPGGNATPVVNGVSPNAGSSQPGVFQTFQFTVSDSDGAATIASAAGLISTAGATQNACYVEWLRSGNQIRLYREDGASSQSVALGTAGNLSNSQCTVGTAQSSVVSSGNTLTFVVSAAFQPAFAGAKRILARVQDTASADSGWTSVGSWNVAGCSYSLNPTSASQSDAAGTYSVAVTSAGGCAWSASSSAPWITITSGASGNGNGTVSYALAANTSTTPRTGSITVGGVSFSITQRGAAPAPACGEYVLSPASVSVSATGGSLSLWVSTGGGCIWSASTNNAWITLTGGTGGNGSGPVNFVVAPNPTNAARSGSLMVAGRVFPVVQQGAALPVCSFSLSASSANTSIGGGAFTVTVTAPGGCNWTAVSNSSWITVTSGATGSGNGSVGYSVSANSGTSQRSGTLTIAGATFTVTQLAAAPAIPPSPSEGLLFIPVKPCRLVDTRSVSQPSLRGQDTRTFNLPSIGCGLPVSAKAFSLNVTAVPQGPLPFLTVWPAGQTLPNVSTLNSLDGRIKANAAIVPAGVNGGVNVYAAAATDVILDVNGYFVANSDPNGLAFYPVAPCRVADTRLTTSVFGGPVMRADEVRGFPVNSSSCGIPSTARAYSLNATVVPNGPLPYITMYPTGQAQPLVSTLNSLTGTVVANAAIVPAGIGGSIDVYAAGNTHLVLDVNGYFAPTGQPGALQLYNVQPCRVCDSRNSSGVFGGPIIEGQQSREFPIPASSCGVPSSAVAFALNATVVPRVGLGYLTLWPADKALPLASTLNSTDGSIASNAAIVPSGPGGSIRAFPSSTTHLILDVSGYFAP